MRNVPCLSDDVWLCRNGLPEVLHGKGIADNDGGQMSATDQLFLRRAYRYHTKFHRIGQTALKPCVFCEAEAKVRDTNGLIWIDADPKLAESMWNAFAMEDDEKLNIRAKMLKNFLRSVALIGASKLTTARAVKVGNYMWCEKCQGWRMPSWRSHPPDKRRCKCRYLQLQ